MKDTCWMPFGTKKAIPESQGFWVGWSNYNKEACHNDFFYDQNKRSKELKGVEIRQVKLTIVPKKNKNN
jgi:hypothetical protein